MTRFGGLSLASALALIACGGGDPGAGETPSSATAGAEGVGPHHGQGMEERAGMMGGGEMLGMMCPMMTDETRVTVEPIEGGAALVFTTVPDQLEMLREHVEHMAAMPGWTGMGRGPRGAEQMPPASATATSTADGARLELRARDEADVDALRASLRARAERLTTRECPMMRAGTTAMR